MRPRLTLRARPGNRQFPRLEVIGIKVDGPVGIDGLEVCGRYQAKPQRGSNGLAPNAGAQLLEDVPKMGFDRGSCKTEILGQVLGRVPLRHPPKYLHLAGGKVDLAFSRKGR